MWDAFDLPKCANMRSNTVPNDFELNMMHTKLSFGKEDLCTQFVKISLVLGTSQTSISSPLGIISMLTFRRHTLSTWFIQN